MTHRDAGVWSSSRFRRSLAGRILRRAAIPSVGGPPLCLAWRGKVTEPSCFNECERRPEAAGGRPAARHAGRVDSGRDERRR